MSLFSKKAYVGLDIGHHALKAVQVERTQAGWHVSKSISAPTPEDTVRDGVVIEPALLGLAIKNMLKAGHIHATTAAIAISGGTVVVRPVRMPKMAESALRKSIRFEASRYVPNSVEDSYIEFEIIGDADATNMDVIIAAAPKELVDSRVQACENAGLEVEHVEVAAFAAYRSVIEADLSFDWSDKTLGLVDIGASVTNLGVVSNGTFSMTRAIPAGGQVLTDALKSYFKLSDEDAESGKSQLDVRGLMNEHAVAENPPLRVLHTHVDDLVREVRRSINYWQSQQSEGATAKRMDAIILFGGGANLPGLAEYFEHKLGITTEAKGLFQNPRFLGAHTDANRGMDIAVAVGLSMGLAPSKAVSRAPKPAKLIVEKSTTPPKNPKPPKPGKGKSIKGSKKVADSSIESPAEVQETVEVAAIAATQTMDTTPHAFQPTPPSVIEEPKLFEASTSEELIVGESAPTLIEADSTEKYGPELAALLDEAPKEIPTLNEQSILAEEPAAQVSPDEKYGPELAALLGEAPAETPTLEATPATEVHHQSEVAELLEAAEAAFDSAPIATEVAEVTANEVVSPVAPPINAPTFNSWSANDSAPQTEMSALLDGASTTEPSATAPPARKSLFTKFGKSEKAEKPAKPAKEVKVKEAKQPKAAQAPKVEKAPKEASESGRESKLGNGFTRMFRSSGKANAKPTDSAAAPPQFENVGGAGTFAVDSTLREAKPSPTVNPPEPKVLAEADAKVKTKRMLGFKKLRSSDQSKDQKKEAA